MAFGGAVCTAHAKSTVSHRRGPCAFGLYAHQAGQGPATRRPVPPRDLVKRNPPHRFVDRMSPYLDLAQQTSLPHILRQPMQIGPKEVQINGKAPGETSLIIWQENDVRLVYDLTVRASPMRLNAVREQIARDFPDAGVNVTFDNDTAFVRGTVKDVVSADRIVAMVSTLGKPINLLRVEIPPMEPQILLKVRFANVDRSAGRDLG